MKKTTLIGGDSPWKMHGQGVCSSFSACCCSSAYRGRV